MKAIVVEVRPFTAAQKISLFDEHAVVETQFAAMDSLVDAIVELANKENVSDVKIAGPLLFNKKIAKDIVKKEVLKYNSKNIVVELI